MFNISYTQHSEKRMNQRGVKKANINLIKECGTLLEDRNADAWVMTSKNVDYEIARRKKQIQELDKLRGILIIMKGNTLITTYKMHPKKLQNRLLNKF